MQLDVPDRAGDAASPYTKQGATLSPESKICLRNTACYRIPRAFNPNSSCKGNPGSSTHTFSGKASLTDIAFTHFVLVAHMGARASVRAIHNEIGGQQ